MEGLPDDAIEEYAFSVGVLADPESVASLGHAYALAGRTSEAEESLAELARMEKTRYVSAYWKALVYAGLGDIDSALPYLEQAVDSRCDWSVHAAEEPMMDPLRSDPRFHSILGRIGLTTSGG